jgi:hypothetical protein
MCCGDLSGMAFSNHLNFSNLGFDSERSHHLDLSNIDKELRERFNLTDSWTKQDPIAPPTEPAYKHSVSLKRNGMLEKPVTSKLETMLEESSLQD